MNNEVNLSYFTLQVALEDIYDAIASGALTADTIGTKSEFVAKHSIVTRESVDKVSVICTVNFSGDLFVNDHDADIVLDKSVFEALKKHNPMIHIGDIGNRENVSLPFNEYYCDYWDTEDNVRAHMHTYEDNVLLDAYRRLEKRARTETAS